MISSLVLISMVMSASLAFVYIKTKGPIAMAAHQKEIDAIRRVVPEFDNEPASSQWEFRGLPIYRLTKGGKPVGFAVKSFTNNGFNGHIELMAGFLPDGAISGIALISHRETPGLGTKMADLKFSNQFLGKNPENFPLKVKKDGGQVDAITAATISSRAYCDALQRAHSTLVSLKDSLSLTNP
jgi:electron transport complex protein RnfG